MDTNTRARLVSLNVGMPRQLNHRGQVVQSAIFKTPEEDKLWLDENRLEGPIALAAYLQLDTWTPNAFI